MTYNQVLHFHPDSHSLFYNWSISFLYNAFFYIVEFTPTVLLIIFSLSFLAFGVAYWLWSLFMVPYNILQEGLLGAEFEHRIMEKL